MVVFDSAVPSGTGQGVHMTATAEQLIDAAAISTGSGEEGDVVIEIAPSLFQACEPVGEETGDHLSGEAWWHPHREAAIGRDQTLGPQHGASSTTGAGC